MVKPYTLHLVSPWVELVKSGKRNLVESRAALWREAGFLSPTGTVWCRSEGLGLEAVCQSSCSLTICLRANVLARFTCEANPIKWKDRPWQLRACLIKLRPCSGSQWAFPNHHRWSGTTKQSRVGQQSSGGQDRGRGRWCESKPCPGVPAFRFHLWQVSHVPGYNVLRNSRVIWTNL